MTGRPASCRSVEQAINPSAVSAVLVTMPVGMIGLPHHALRQFKEPILMPPSHGWT